MTAPEDMMVDIDRGKKERTRKDTAVFPSRGGEVTSPENIEALYASEWSWGIEEEDGTHFPDWKGVDDYWDPVDPNYLSVQFVAVLLEVVSLLNSHL